MTTVPPEVLTALVQRRGVTAHALYWITGRSRITGQPESLGLWTGGDAQIFAVGAEQRIYYGPVALAAGRLRAAMGLMIPSLELSLADVAPEVETLVRNYDLSGAPIEIHIVAFDLESGAQISAPFERFRGRVDTLKFSEGPISEAGVASGSADLVAVPQTERLTARLPAWRTDADQSQRVATGDRFFRHAATAAVTEVLVGEQRQG